MSNPQKERLLAEGVETAEAFCAINGLDMPDVVRVPDDAPWAFGTTCAYYRPTTITIYLPRCGILGEYGRLWSWPGYMSDRTPYGVIAHELGHHYDMQRSKEKDRYRGDFSQHLRALSKEDPITSYAPDDGEWFAEMFRVFVSNPDLLEKVRPRTYALIRNAGVTPLFWDTWQLRINGAPTRTYAAVENAIEKAKKHAKKNRVRLSRNWRGVASE